MHAIKEKAVMRSQIEQRLEVNRNIKKIHSLCAQLQEICKDGNKYIFTQHHQKCDITEIVLFLISEAAREVNISDASILEQPAIEKIGNLMIQRPAMSDIKASIFIWNIIQYDIPNLMDYCLQKMKRQNASSRKN
jgi:hypothetical protein